MYDIFPLSFPCHTYNKDIFWTPITYMWIWQKGLKDGTRSLYNKKGTYRVERPTSPVNSIQHSWTGQSQEARSHATTSSLIVVTRKEVSQGRSRTCGRMNALSFSWLVGLVTANTSSYILLALRGVVSLLPSPSNDYSLARNRTLYNRVIVYPFESEKRLTPYCVAPKLCFLLTLEMGWLLILGCKMKARRTM